MLRPAGAGRSRARADRLARRRERLTAIVVLCAVAVSAATVVALWLLPTVPLGRLLPALGAAGGVATAVALGWWARREGADGGPHGRLVAAAALGTVAATAMAWLPIAGAAVALAV